MDALKSLVQPLVGGAGGSSVIDGMKLVVLGGTVETARRVSSSAWYVPILSHAPTPPTDPHWLSKGLTLLTVRSAPSTASDCAYGQIFYYLQHSSSLLISLRRTTHMTGSCCGFPVAQSGNVRGSSRLPLAPRPPASQVLALPTTRSVTRRRKVTRKDHLARSRPASSSSLRSIPRTPFTTEATGSECVVPRRRTVAAAKSFP